MSISLETLNVVRDSDISTLASKTVKSCAEEESILSVVEKIVMTEHRRVPILSKGGRLVGIITKSDILDAFLRGEDLGSKIASIMTRDVITCLKSESVEYVLHKFKMTRRGGFPVLDGNKVVGMISERDFVRLIKGKETGIHSMDVMTRKPFCVRSNISLMDCLKTMVNTHYRRMPVLDHENKGKVVGLVTMTDLLKYIHETGFNTGALDEDMDTLLRRKFYSVKKEADISEVVDIIASKDIGGVPVINDEGMLEGIITERDILEELI